MMKTFVGRVSMMGGAFRGSLFCFRGWRDDAEAGSICERVSG